jgi:hypothetical protein
MQTSSADKTEGFRLLRDTVEDVVKRGRHSRPEGVKPQMQLQGNFDERRLGFSSFTEFLSAAEQAGWITRSIDAGGHTVLSVSEKAPSRTPSLPPPDPTTPPARRSPRKGQAPPSAVVPGKSVGLGAELAQLRGLVHRAVDQMSADELRGLSLPLRYVLSPLGAAEVIEVESQIDRVLEEARERLPSGTVTLVEQSEQDGPKDMVTAVEVAESEARHVVYVAQARGRAKASPYKAPGEVLQGLRELDRLAGIYKEGGFEGTLTKLFRDRSTLNFRDRVSDATRTRHKDRYTLSWEGKNRLMDPHLCFGSAGTTEECARVYWYIDDATRTWVVGHAGEHLPGAYD